MAAGSFRFEAFHLDLDDRRLKQDGAPVELNARYLDALALLVREQGKLVSKDRFLEEVWRGVPVTDEALTQCIKTLRRQLGDDASRPRFIETVPKHGYRFIAPVEILDDGSEYPAPIVAPPESKARSPRSLRQNLLLAGAGTVGGGVAGFIGGLFYGFAGASQPLQPGLGAASVLLVILCLTIVVALMGAAGVGLGIVAAGVASGRLGPWLIAGGAAGGLFVGGFVKLLGLDAFNLLVGQSPGDITGGPEGLLIGGAVGFAAWLAFRSPFYPSLRRGMAVAGVSGAAAGIAISLLGGRLMGGSLDLLAAEFPESRLRLDLLASMFGETSFGPISRIATAGLEGLLFGGCLVGAMIIARRDMGEGV
jgi:DNA-binding winged helix-turn-helix (wHTH) protein